MMRLCPKCGDYYADASLAFCLDDGTPLVDVNPLTESWREGERVIEEKTNALRRRERRLKWRRILSVLTTMLMVTMVLIVVAVNGFIYLKPKREEVALAPTSPPATPPAEPVASITPSPPGTPSPTVSPSPTATLTATPTPTPTYTVQSECTDDDKIRERAVVINSCGGVWRRAIEGDRIKILAGYGVAGLENVSASLSEKIEYQITFSQACRAGVVTARYSWQVTAPTIRTVPLLKETRFKIVKAGERWRCG